MKIRIRQFALYLFLVLSMLLYSCNMPGTATIQAPTQVSTEVPVQIESSTLPENGTLMSWVDGSILVFNGNTWMYQSEVSYYQFSLCVEAGICTPEEDEKLAMEAALLDPELINQAMPMKAQGPSDPCTIQYCGWAGGRVLTEAENAVIGVDSGSPLAETVHGFKCAVDSPHPIAAACETSAFYLNGAPPEMDHTVEQAGAFCQNGESFVTLDINLMEGAVIQSVDGACEVLDDNRVLCSGEPGSNMDGLAFFSCDELPAVQDNSAPVAGQLQCLPGYEPNIESPATCTIIGPDRSMQDHPLVGQVSLVVFEPDSIQSNHFQSDCPIPFTYDANLSQCVFEIPPENLVRASLLGVCPDGFGFDAQTGLCIPNVTLPGLPSGLPTPSAEGDCPEGSILYAGVCVPDQTGFPTPDADGRCPSGYTIVPDSRLCIPRISLPGFSSSYPTPSADGSCPEGYIFNSATGLCTPNIPGPHFPSLPPGFPTPSADGHCPDGSNLYAGVCIPNGPGFPTPDADGHCPTGYTLLPEYRVCLPSISIPGLSSGYPTPDGNRNCPSGYRYNSQTNSCLSNALPGGFEFRFPTPGADGSCPDGLMLYNGSCVPRQTDPNGTTSCLFGFRYNEATGRCLPDFPLGCPIGSYFNTSSGLCIAPDKTTNTTLAGFHFDETLQCSQSDLPSERYPGCPDGQAYDPLTGACNSENTWIEDGKRIYAVEFNFSAPSCDPNGAGGSENSCKGLDKPKCTTTSGCTWDGVSCN